MRGKAASTPILIALAGLFGLGAISSVRVLLWFFMVPIIVGLLVHAALIAFAAEALTGRGPREFILIPIVAYGGYYAAYAYQGYEISQRAAELRRGNLGKVFAFDAAQHSLVTAEAETLVKTHEIPVAYAENVNFKPERHLAYRLIPRERCGRGVDSQGRVIWSGVHFADKFQNQLCELRTPEGPGNKISRAARRAAIET